jgi:dihydrofolate reductase
MIKFIAALDQKLGIADDRGIPWFGRTPTDMAYFRSKTEGGINVMGMGVYKELEEPLPNRQNFVATHNDEPLKQGFLPVHDLVQFLRGQTEDVWVIGGAAIFASTIDMADELYLTEIEADFNCTKFFPPFAEEFELVSRSEPITENGLTFTFCIYRRKS